MLPAGIESCRSVKAHQLVGFYRPVKAGLRTLKTSYTVFRVLFPCCKRLKDRRDDSIVLCRSDERCLETSRGELVRDDTHGNNDTSSRPPVDYGGASAVCATLAKGRYKQSYDAGSHRQPEIPP